MGMIETPNQNVCKTQLIQHRVRRFGSRINFTFPSRFCPSQGLLQPRPSLLIPNLQVVVTAACGLGRHARLEQKFPVFLAGVQVFLDKNDRISNFFWHSARFPTSFCPKVRTLYRKTFLHTILEYRCYVSHAIAGLLSPFLVNACHPTFLSTLPHLILPSDT